MLETALFRRIGAIAPNIYPNVAPERYSTPAVIYNRLDTDPERDLDGETGTGFIIAQIDVYDPKYLVAKQLADTIKNNLVAWQDEEVQSVGWTGSNDMTDETTAVTLYRTRMTFVIFANL